MPTPPPSRPPTCGELYSDWLGAPRDEMVEVNLENATVLINNLGGLASTAQPPVMRFGGVGTLAREEEDAHH